MSWIEKESSTPFDTQSIPGLYFLDGDYASRTRHTPWTQHKTYATIVFPSGAQCDLDRHPEPDNATVHIFGALRVPLVDTNAQAIAEATTIGKAHWYGIEPIDDHSFIATNDAESAVIAYDPVTRQLRNVLFMRNGERVSSSAAEMLDSSMRQRFPDRVPENPLTLDTIAPVRFYLPESQWSWYATAFDGIDTFFGLVVEDTIAYHSFSLTDLARLRSVHGVSVVPDYDFTPATLRDLKEMHERTRLKDRLLEDRSSVSFPTNGISYEDVLSVRPDLANQITVSDIERAASKVGDLLQEFYWDVLETYLGEQFPLLDDEWASDE